MRSCLLRCKARLETAIQEVEDCLQCQQNAADDLDIAFAKARRDLQRYAETIAAEHQVNIDNIEDELYGTISNPAHLNKKDKFGKF